MNLINRLLRKNVSPARVAGFVLSNFAGLAIVVAAVQFFCDLRPIYTADDSFVSTDYMVLNKRVTSGAALGGAQEGFSAAEVADLRRQPWVRSVGEFTSNDYRAYASIAGGGRQMSTFMFFESIPAGYIDVARGQWHFDPAVGDVPVILSKDYLTLYNFGFATSAGLPQLSESLMGSVPLRLRLRSEDGGRSLELDGHVVGFSNRLNTILVPEEFMRWSNSRLGGGDTRLPSRVIVDVSSPGDVAIDDYLDRHGLEVAGDKSASSASYLLKVVTGVVAAVGAVITLLSFFILLLSISLLMERNRDKLHTLLMLGYPLRSVAAPYRRLVAVSACGACMLAFVAVYLLRAAYIGRVEAMGGGGDIWASAAAGLLLTALTVTFNIVAVNRRVASSFRLSR